MRLYIKTWGRHWADGARTRSGGGSAGEPVVAPNGAAADELKRATLQVLGAGLGRGVLRESGECARSTGPATVTRAPGHAGTRSEVCGPGRARSVAAGGSPARAGHRGDGEVPGCEGPKSSGEVRGRGKPRAASDKPRPAWSNVGWEAPGRATPSDAAKGPVLVGVPKCCDESRLTVSSERSTKST